MTNELLLLHASLIDFLRTAGAVGMPLSWVQVLVPSLILAGLWGVFEKASRMGWACLIPLYAEITLCRIVGKPWWWVLLLIAPLVGGVAQLVVFAFLVERFAKGTGYYMGTVLLPFVFLPMLGFGSATYRAPFKRSGRLKA